MRRVWYVARIALVVALVAVTAQGGIGDGMSAWRGGASSLETAAAAIQLAYGALSLAVLLAMAFRREWVTAVMLAWGVPLTATGTLAPVVWGEQPWVVGLAGGAATAAVVALAIAGWRAHARSAAAAATRERGR